MKDMWASTLIEIQVSFITSGSYTFFKVSGKFLPTTSNNFPSIPHDIYYLLSHGILRHPFYSKSIEHSNCPTPNDYKRSVIGDKSMMSKDHKWVFDASHPNDPFQHKCTQKMGYVFTRFEGYGVGKLTYGGCAKGRGEVHLDGNRIDHIGADVLSKVVTFSFAPYSELELKEMDDESVIELISLEVGCKGINQRLFKSQLNVIIML